MKLDYGDVFESRAREALATGQAVYPTVRAEATLRAISAALRQTADEARAPLLAEVEALRAENELLRQELDQTR